MNNPLVYTLSLTPQAQRFCDGMAAHGVRFVHYETEHDLVLAIHEEVPTCVVMHGSAQEARDVEARLRGVQGCSRLRVVAIGKFDRSDKDDDIFGTATAVMTIFDSMPEMDDSDPWVRRPI